jgi:hypothetical protein
MHIYDSVVAFEKGRHTTKRSFKIGLGNPPQYSEDMQIIRDQEAWGYLGTQLAMPAATSVKQPTLTIYCNKVDSDDLDLVLCNMVHSHDWPGRGNYIAFVTEPQKHCVDIGSFVVKTEIAKAVGFRDKTFAGDGTFIEDIMQNSGRAVKWGKVDKILFVHN